MKEVTQSRPSGLISTPEITTEELQLAVRNHSMPLEALRYDITPVGLHYLLIHFDIPDVDAAAYELRVGGLVDKPMRLRLDDIKSRPATTIAVTLECAGNGRSRLSPRPKSQPWVTEAVGTAEWTGTPLAPILAEAGVKSSALEVVFTGLDRGVQGEVDQWYERSLTIADASRPEVLLVYAINGMPLPPQHGFPLRVIVPGWYGMTQVKWLRSITAIDKRFQGYQQAEKYQFQSDTSAPSEPVTRMLPRALMLPPGVPDYMSRTRFVEPGQVVVEGRAWSGRAPITAVDVSEDGGATWSPASLDAPVSPFAWRRWEYRWDATRPGVYELCARATDAAGNVQPAAQNWSLEGVQNNAVQRVPVTVGRVDSIQPPADSLA